MHSRSVLGHWYVCWLNTAPQQSVNTSVLKSLPVYSASLHGLSSGDNVNDDDDFEEVTGTEVCVVVGSGAVVLLPEVLLLLVDMAAVVVESCLGVVIVVHVCEQGLFGNTCR